MYVKGESFTLVVWLELSPEMNRTYHSRKNAAGLRYKEKTDKSQNTVPL